MNIDRFKSLIFEFRRQAGGEKFMTRNRANYIWEQVKKLDDIVVENFFKPYIQNSKQDPFASGLEGALKKLIDPNTPIQTEEVSPAEDIGISPHRPSTSDIPEQFCALKSDYFKPPPNAYVRTPSDCCEFGLIYAQDKNKNLYAFKCSVCLNGQKAEQIHPKLPFWIDEYAKTFTKV